MTEPEEPQPIEVRPDGVKIYSPEDFQKLYEMRREARLKREREQRDD